MRIKYPGYSFTNALFVIFMEFVQACCWLVTMFTFGHIGRFWALRVTSYCLDHKNNVVYSGNE